MPVRFHAPDAAAPGQLLELPGDEAVHLVRVLRLGPGAAVRVFDGAGREFDGVVEQIQRTRAYVRLLAEEVPVAEPGIAITLAQAVLKGDAMDRVVRDAVMIGAAAIRPVVSARSETSLAALERGHRRERWSRVALASAKQCGRATIPPVEEPCTFETLLARLANVPLSVITVEPAAIDRREGGTAFPVPGATVATVVVGPEGGWTPEELDRVRGICRPCTLGARTLRAETMGLVALTALFTAWGELGR